MRFNIIIFFTKITSELRFSCIHFVFSIEVLFNGFTNIRIIIFIIFFFFVFVWNHRHAIQFFISKLFPRGSEWRRTLRNINHRQYFIIRLFFLSWFWIWRGAICKPWFEFDYYATHVVSSKTSWFGEA